MTNSELFENEETTLEASKYQNWDVEALRKKAEAADNHIRTLEAEAAARREVANTETTLQEVLRRLEQQHNPPMNYETPVVNQTPAVTSQGEQITKQDVLSILEQEQKKNQAKANVDLIKGELRKVWGDNFSQRLSEKSNEIGVSQDFLANMAENYPQAFLRLVLEDKVTTNPNVHVAPTSLNTQKPAGSSNLMTGETRKDFRAAEKANPALIHDANFQARKHAAAQRLGDAFFK